MNEGKQTYHKSEIAKEQLRTAIAIFLRNVDHSSVITLAGAAGNILDQLVRNQGKEPFVDYACRVHSHLVGFTPARKTYSHHIDRKVGIIDHKHMGKGSPEVIDLDLFECAIQALTKAASDYTTLFGKEEPFIKAFYNWTWQNLDGPRVMEEYGKAPVKLKNNGPKDLQKI